MQQLSDCFQEAVSLKINPSYNKRLAPHVLGLVFRRSSSSLQFVLRNLQRELRNHRIELFFYEYNGSIGLSLVCKEEKFSIKTNMLNYNENMLGRLLNSVDKNEKLVLAFYSLTRDNRMRIVQDNNGDPFFLPVYFSLPGSFHEARSSFGLKTEIAEELCSFIFDYAQWKN